MNFSSINHSKLAHCFDPNPEVVQSKLTLKSLKSQHQDMKRQHKENSILGKGRTHFSFDFGEIKRQITNQSRQVEAAAVQKSIDRKGRMSDISTLSKQYYDKSGPSEPQKACLPSEMRQLKKNFNRELDQIDKDYKKAKERLTDMKQIYSCKNQSKDSEEASRKALATKTFKGRKITFKEVNNPSRENQWQKNTWDNDCSSNSSSSSDLTTVQELRKLDLSKYDTPKANNRKAAREVFRVKDVNNTFQHKAKLNHHANKCCMTPLDRELQRQPKNVIERLKKSINLGQKQISKGCASNPLSPGTPSRLNSCQCSQRSKTYGQLVNEFST